MLVARMVKVCSQQLVILLLQHRMPVAVYLGTTMSIFCMPWRNPIVAVLTATTWSIAGAIGLQQNQSDQQVATQKPATQ